MKGSSAATAVASFSSDDLRQNSLRVASFGDHMAVVAMRRENIIVGAQGGTDTDAGCLLSDVNVKMATNQAFVIFVEADDMFFSPPDHEHLAQKT
jgi:hypothetical protein